MTTHYPTVTPYLLYADAARAIEWLTSVFGFTERLRFTEETGRVSHAELAYGDGLVMLGEPGEGYRNPSELGGRTVLVHVYVDDVDAHFAHARDAGAVITRGPADQEYGDRNYAALDPEGHEWFFAQQTRVVAPEQWGATATS